MGMRRESPLPGRFCKYSCEYSAGTGRPQTKRVCGRIKTGFPQPKLQSQSPSLDRLRPLEIADNPIVSRIPSLVHVTGERGIQPRDFRKEPETSHRVVCFVGLTAWCLGFVAPYKDEALLAFIVLSAVTAYSAFALCYYDALGAAWHGSEVDNTCGLGARGLRRLARWASTPSFLTGSLSTNNTPSKRDPDSPTEVTTEQPRPTTFDSVPSIPSDLF